MKTLTARDLCHLEAMAKRDLDDEVQLSANLKRLGMAHEAESTEARIAEKRARLERLNASITATIVAEAAA